ncbi:MAG: efflux RND transporter periplasmic adaptor subunit [Bacteroidales bacterium]|nr:efflux RND transporter periplasmic adaptor subunit [Bacteroidales bacterium]
MKTETYKEKSCIAAKYKFLSGFKSSCRRLTPLIIFLAIMLFYGCKSEKETEAIPKTKKVPSVSVQAAQKTDMISYIDITGTIEANIFTNITAPADGIVESLSARENQRVENDKVIAIIDPIDRVALISENQLKLEQIEKALNNTEQGSIERERLTGELEKAKQDLEYAKNMYRTVPVVCPMSGLVTKRFIDKGSRVSVRDNMFTITDMNSLVIKASVNEKFFSAIRQGKKLPLVLYAYPNDTLQGMISLVYPQVDPVTRNIKFDVKILNFNKKLLPGMMTAIKIPVSVKEDAVTVPEHAILTSPQEENFLFVVNSDNVALRRLVEKGISSANKIEVVSGLKEGEQVVVAGQELLKDSMKVKIVN